MYNQKPEKKIFCKTKKNKTKTKKNKKKINFNSLCSYNLYKYLKLSFLIIVEKPIWDPFSRLLAQKNPKARIFHFPTFMLLQLHGKNWKRSMN